MTTADRWQLDFIESISGVAETFGLPPSFVQVFGWLIVCDPETQSAEQIRAALGLSSGAVSMATTALVRSGLAERVSLPGRRRQHWRLRTGGWERILRAKIDAAGEIREIAEKALARAPDPPARLGEMRDVYAWAERNMLDLVERAPWRQHPPS
jgi:DNA-binding transcriptional regulator GbsR (MarR family)